MQANLGSVDKSLRLIAGLGLLVAAFLHSPFWALPALVLLGTALASRCPLYLPFGFSTK
ncbi:MAG: YgaP family membrane protein [Candidatus Sericytochromatia bacterium]